MEAPRCGAKRKTGEPCRGWAVRGTERCRMHLGRKAVVAIHEHTIQAKARTMFGRVVDLQPVDNPLAAYAQFTGRVMAWMQTMNSLVEDLDSPRYVGLTAEQIRGEVQLFERALDRCNTVLSTYARLNIDERLTRITEAQQAMVLAAIEAALASADVTGERATVAKRAAARRLRVVA